MQLTPLSPTQKGKGRSAELCVDEPGSYDQLPHPHPIADKVKIEN